MPQYANGPYLLRFLFCRTYSVALPSVRDISYCCHQTHAECATFLSISTNLSNTFTNYCDTREINNMAGEFIAAIKYVLPYKLDLDNSASCFFCFQAMITHREGVSFNKQPFRVQSSTQRRQFNTYTSPKYRILIFARHST